MRRRTEGLRCNESSVSSASLKYCQAGRRTRRQRPYIKSSATPAGRLHADRMRGHVFSMRALTCAELRAHGGRLQMQHVRSVRFVASIMACAALTACGGGSSTTSSTPAAAPTATSVAYGEQNALPLAVAARVPSGLKCGKEDIVWANMHTKAFHDPGDPYYGKTKNGVYMCRDTALTNGYHPAGQRHKNTGGNMNSQNMNSSNMNSGNMGNTMMASPSPGTHHRRYRGTNPAPSPT